jgi:ABC-type oligopeptide transport system ATPase subunit
VKDNVMHNYLHIENAKMVFDTKKGKFTALTDINLNVKQGEFIALIGHSGCGKSTLLNLVAGLTEATEGILLLSEREIKGPGPERGGGVSEPQPAALAVLFRQRLSGGGARVRRQGKQGEAEGTHTGGAGSGRASPTPRTSIRTKSPAA